MNYSRLMIALVVAIGTVLVLIEWSGFAVTDNVVIPYVQSVVGRGVGLLKEHTEKIESTHQWTCESLRHSSTVAESRQAQLETAVNTRNYTNVAFEDTTSPKFTVVTIEDRKVSYQPCDLLTVKIEARDWRNKTKNYGGDFFRLKIFSEEPSYSAAGEDEIIDFNNGTYLVYFTLRWSGKVMVQVKLIHPVELLPQMRLTSSGMVGLNVTFVGEFISQNISEEVICRYVEIEPPFCNFSNPRTHGPWYCKKPKDPRLSCQDWKFHKMYKGTFLKLEENLSPLSRSLLKKSHMIEIRNKLSVTVKGNIEQGVSLDMPYCSMNGVPNGIRTSGHFFQDRWYPNDCRVVDYSIDGGVKCLAGRNVVILGDSTIRQFFEYFRDTYKKYLTLLPFREDAIKTQGPLALKSDKFNTSIKYHFHGLPMSGTGLVLRTDNIEFIVDRINSGKDGCEVIYVLSLWAHFIATGKEFYSQRLLSIKSAVQSFLDRCPRSKVIIKGANTKDHPAVWIAIVSSEWNIVQHELELRRIFEDEKRVGFIDAFDVTKVQPYKDQVHPDRKIVKEFINRLLTYICKVNVKS